MGFAGGLGSQLMIAEEPAYGTYTAPTRTLDIVNENIKKAVARLESAGLTGRRLIHSRQWLPGAVTVTGDVQTELANVNQGLLLKHMLGAVSTTNVSTVYTHTFTPGDLTGKSLTIQVGKPDISETVRAFSYLGCKVDSWELSVKAPGLADLKLTISAQDEVTSQALASPTYPANMSPLTFVGASLNIGGSLVPVKECTLKGSNGFDTTRHMVKASGLISEQLEAGLRDYGGTFKADFTDLTLYNDYLTGAETALVLLFKGALITGGSYYQHQITCNVRFDGDTPSVAGPALLEQDITFKCVGTEAGGDAAAISWAYQTTDTTP